tara:strand:- start:8561 stop:8890 length:330 start_codon:yes stop_codon:yes gene_type:complete
MSLINVDLSDTIVSWRNKTNQLAINLGDITLLTDSASSIIAGINVLTALQSSADSDILALTTAVYGDSGGILDLSALNTTDKTSIISAINEVDRRLIDIYDASGTLLNT